MTSDRQHVCVCSATGRQRGDDDGGSGGRSSDRGRAGPRRSDRPSDDDVVQRLRTLPVTEEHSADRDRAEAECRQPERGEHRDGAEEERGEDDVPERLRAREDSLKRCHEHRERSAAFPMGAPKASPRPSRRDRARRSRRHRTSTRSRRPTRCRPAPDRRGHRRRQRRTRCRSGCRAAPVERQRRARPARPSTGMRRHSLQEAGHFESPWPRWAIPKSTVQRATAVRPIKHRGLYSGPRGDDTARDGPWNAPAGSAAASTPAPVLSSPSASA